MQKLPKSSKSTYPQGGPNPKLQKGYPIWEYESKAGPEIYPKKISDILEGAFSSGCGTHTMTNGPNKHFINFKNMTNKNQTKGEETRICRIFVDD